ncbi:MAG: hypothetical protein HGA19_19220 [Oscillochloris sp.]|nr:hypothetical protein [Oscillochloris sp.]
MKGSALPFAIIGLIAVALVGLAVGPVNAAPMAQTTATASLTTTAATTSTPAASTATSAATTAATTVATRSPTTTTPSTLPQTGGDASSPIGLATLAALFLLLGIGAFAATRLGGARR